LSHDDDITGAVRPHLPHIGRSAANPGIGM
jgi:hypothetical protein